MPVDLKRSMTSHNTWVNDSIKRAKKFIDDNPDGLSTPGDRKVAERLIGKIEENITNMKTKWTTVFEPELVVCLILLFSDSLIVIDVFNFPRIFSDDKNY